MKYYLMLLCLSLTVAGCNVNPQARMGREVHMTTVTNKSNHRSVSYVAVGVDYVDLMFDRKFNDQYGAVLYGKGPVYENPRFHKIVLGKSDVYQGTVTIDEKNKKAVINMHHMMLKNGKMARGGECEVNGIYPITLWKRRDKNPVYDDEP